MTPADFIHQNVKKILINDGYEQSVAIRAAHEAVDHFKRSSSASKKGAMFDDCLERARRFARSFKKKTRSTVTHRVKCL